MKTRDPKRVLNTLKELDDGTVISTTGCEIHIPADYLEKNLGVMDQNIRVLGVFAITLADGTWALHVAHAMVNLANTDTRKYTVKGKEYIAFIYRAGATVYKSLDVVQDAILSYYIYDYFIDSSRIPYFMNYDDVLRFYEDNDYYTGKPLGSTRMVLPIIISNIARNPNDRSQYYRQAVNDGVRVQPSWVPFKSVIFGPKTTTAKLQGAYFDDGLLTALVNPNEHKEDIEEHLRGYPTKA